MSLLRRWQARWLPGSALRVPQGEINVCGKESTSSLSAVVGRVHVLGHWSEFLRRGHCELVGLPAFLPRWPPVRAHQLPCAPISETSFSGHSQRVPCIQRVQVLQFGPFRSTPFSPITYNQDVHRSHQHANGEDFARVRGQCVPFLEFCLPYMGRT